jgi:hypothetical protein
MKTRKYKPIAKTRFNTKAQSTPQSLNYQNPKNLENHGNKHERASTEKRPFSAR